MGERSPPGFRGFFKGDPVPESEPGRAPSAEAWFQLMGWPKARTGPGFWRIVQGPRLS
jgi:hypothetical protein